MRVLIAGIGAVGRQLLTNLAQGDRHELVVVDTDESLCEHLAAEYDALVIHGDATDPEILEKAQIAQADALVASTSSDPINTVIAMLAHRQEVPRIVVTITTGAMRGALEEIGVSAIIAPTMAAAARIQSALHGSEETDLTDLWQAGMQLAEMPVGSEAAGTSLGDHDLPDGTLAIAVHRDDETFVARLDVELREGDVVLALAESEEAAQEVRSALR